jgi:hypothetical protein
MNERLELQPSEEILIVPGRQHARTRNSDPHVGWIHDLACLRQLRFCAEELHQRTGSCRGVGVVVPAYLVHRRLHPRRNKT